MKEYENYHLNNHKEHLEELSEIKRKLYEINNFDKLEAFNEIYINLQQQDEHLVKTLTLIISDFNTNMNMYQTHFIGVIDKMISLEEKRILKELTQPYVSRATDQKKLEPSLVVSQTESQHVVINNLINDVNKDKDIDKNIFLSLVKENKLLVLGIILFIGLLINPMAVKNTIIIMEKLISNK